MSIITDDIKSIGYYVSIIFVCFFFGFLMTASAAVAVNQERKIWKSKPLTPLSIIGCIKVFFFNIMWMVLCFIGSVFIVIKWIITLGQSNLPKDGNELVERGVAKICIASFVGKVQVIGIENLPNENIVPAPVYVANHASQIDVGAVYYLGRQFKWIAKKSVLYLPGVGQIMYLSQHVFIDRRKGKNGKSVSNLFEKSDAAIQAGLPMFIFPQGTRRIVEYLPAKDGAFIIAQNNKSILVPISIEIPNEIWNCLYPINQLWGGKIPIVKVTVHKIIQVNGNEDREKLKQTCMEQIYSILPNYDKEK